MALATVPYDIQIDHDGRKYPIHIAALSLPRCTECGQIAVDDVANEVIESEFRKQARLLSPEEIREGRKSLGMTQEMLAEYLGIAAATLSRWETGVQCQQRFHDGVLRAFFKLEPLRCFLGTLHGVPTANAG